MRPPFAMVVAKGFPEGRSNRENRHKPCNRQIRPLLRLDAPAKMKVCRGNVNDQCGNPQDSGVLWPGVRWPASTIARNLQVALGGSNRRFAATARGNWLCQADVGGRDSQIVRRGWLVTARPGIQGLNHVYATTLSFRRSNVAWIFLGQDAGWINFCRRVAPTTGSCGSARPRTGQRWN